MTGAAMSSANLSAGTSKNLNRKPIDFYFDFSSPYGYFMSEKIDALAACHGRSVTWRPVLLFALLRLLDLPAPLENPIKRDYMMADFERSARCMNIEYRMPDKFPAATQHAARAFYCLQLISPQAAVSFAKTMLRSYWREGRDIGNIDGVALEVVVASAQFGIDVGTVADVLEQLSTETTKALLQDAIAAAAKRKVFGSPFVIVEDEPFFGVDRLPQIEFKLAGG